MPTVNKFLATQIAGNFSNIDHPTDTNILASGSFAGDLTIKGNIFIGNEKLVNAVYTNSGGNFCFKINNVDYTITPLMLSYLLNLTGDINTSLVNKADASYVNTQLSNKADTSYVNNQIANIVNSSPTTLDTLNELATALGNDPNFATTVTTSIGTKASTSDMNTALALKLNVNNPVATGVLTFNNSEGRKIIYYGGANIYTYYSCTIEASLIRYNVPNNATHQFSCANATSTAFNDLLIINSTGMTSTVPFTGTNGVFSDTVTSTNITSMNNTLALKSDKTYVDGAFATITNLSLKSNIQNPVFTHNLTLPGASGATRGNLFWQDASNYMRQFSVSGTCYIDCFGGFRIRNSTLAGGTISTPFLIDTSGNTILSGTLTSPTITTINNTLALKSDRTYVDGAFATITNLALKSDKTYVDTSLNNLQNQINQLPTSSNINSKADISYCDTTFATITNLNLKSDKTYVDGAFATITNLNLKADSNTPTLIKPTVLNHLLFNGSVSAFPVWSSVNSGAIYGQSKYLLFLNTNTDTLNNTVAFKWQKMYSSGSGGDIMSIANNGDLYVLGNITSPSITSLQNQMDLKATITNLNLKANITDMNLKANITDMNLKANITDMNLKANITDMNLKANITDMNLKADITMVNDGLALKVNKTYADLNYANVNILNNATFPMNLYISSTAGSTLDGNIYIKDNTSNYVRIFAVGSSAYYDAYNAFKVRMTALNGNVVSTAIDINAVGDITLNNIISPTITAINNTLTSINSLLSGVTSNIQNQFNSITSTIANYATSFTTQTLYYDRRIGRTSVMNVSRTHTFSDLPEYISVNISGLTLTLPEITNLTQNGSVVYVFLNGGNFSVTINVTNQQIRYGGSNINNQNNFVFSQGGVCKRFVAINNLWTIFED